MERHKKTRLFLVLFSLGFLGVASLVLIDVSAIIALLPSVDAPIPVMTGMEPRAIIGVPIVGAILAYLLNKRIRYHFK